MKTRWKKLAAIAATCVMASTAALGFTACGKSEKPYAIEKRARTGWKDERVYTQNEYTSQMPDVWTELMSNDATNLDMASYFNSSFFEYDFKFDSNGEIVPGEFTIKYGAATKLEDVTAKYEGQYGIDEDAVEEGGHAFAITLRQDLKWDNGDAIKAADFVYTMSQQLSPKYKLENASNYYSGNYVLHNAKEYLYQGQSDFFDNGVVGYEFSDLVLENGVYTLDGHECFIVLKSALEWLGGNSLSAYVGAYGDKYFGVEAYKSLAALANDKGQVTLTEESLALLKHVITDVAAWGETEEETINYLYVDYTYPEMDFSEVGYFVGENEYELVFVTDNPLAPIDKDGNLTYQAAYYFESFPLVKKNLWESLEDSSKTPYENAYCSVSVANSASWGPYKLTSYAAGTSYLIERNTNWYGYGLSENDNFFQTDRVYVRYVPEWNTAWELFQKGEIDGVSMDVSIQQDYRNSRQAYFTPSTATFDLNLNSKPNSHTSERNNLMLKYDEFRKALSLAINRDDYCARNNPSSQGALGFLNNMYYYDVENGGVYRETVQAKEALLNAYGAEKTANGWKVGNVEYDDLDDAVDALTGYNVSLARELIKSAYEKAKAAGDYVDGENIILTFGTESVTSSSDRVKNWFQTAFDEATKGTPLQGKIKIEYFMYSSATWDDQFLNGEYDLCFSGWSNAPFDPYYLFGETQIAEDNRYALGWDPDTVEVTLTIKGDETHPGYENLTMNLNEWNNCLQGKSGARYNFKYYPVEDKLNILAAEESAVLQAYWSLPVFSRYSASLMGYKCDYYTYEYNTFVGYGGLKYMTYHFDDTEWAKFVKDHGNKLNYKFGR